MSHSLIPEDVPRRSTRTRSRAWKLLHKMLCLFAASVRRTQGHGMCSWEIEVRTVCENTQLWENRMGEAQESSALSSTVSGLVPEGKS